MSPDGKKKPSASRKEIILQAVHSALTAFAFCICALLFAVSLYNEGVASWRTAILLAVCTGVAWDLFGDVRTLVRTVRAGRQGEAA